MNMRTTDHFKAFVCESSDLDIIIGESLYFETIIYELSNLGTSFDFETFICE